MAEGRPAQVVAQRLGRNRGTVAVWVQRCHAPGRTDLQPQGRGPPGHGAQVGGLDPTAARRAAAATSGGLADGDLVGTCGRGLGQTHVQANDLPRHARRELHPLGLRRKRPRPRGTTAHAEAHQAFAQALVPRPRREPGSVPVDMDHGHIWPAALPRLGWGGCGQPAWSASASPATRGKRLCAVAVVRPLGRVITQLWAWCTPEPTARFVAKVRRCLRGRAP